MSEIRDILKISKTMKRPKVLISNSFICGSDEDFATLSVITIETYVGELATDLTDVIDRTKHEKWINEHAMEFYSQYRHVGDNVYIPSWNEAILATKLLFLYSKIIRVNSHPIGRFEALDQDPEFMGKVAKLKVADGLMSYLLGGKYLVTSFNKVHSINASDKVDVNVYDYDSTSYLYEFIVNKKSHTVREYIRYRKV